MKVFHAFSSPQLPGLFFVLFFGSLSEHELQEESGDLEEEPEAAGRSSAFYYIRKLALINVLIECEKQERSVKQG